jgi:uncharacterized repeat protein (TIGR01451 family)
MKILLVSGALVGGIATVASAHASTPAGLTLNNVAQLRATVDGAPIATSSNNAAVQVAELLNLQLVAGATAVSLPAGKLAGIPFTLINTGNGNEAFVLAARPDGLSATIEGFAVDVDGNGVYDPAVDTLIDANATTPALPAGGMLKLLALVRGGGTNSGAIAIDARAATGSGTPGTTYPGTGDHGSDAVVGATTAAANTSVRVSVGLGGDASRISLTKSQSVVSPNGGADGVKGATVTYTIQADFGGAGTVPAVRLADPIPAGVAYVPGSLRLDGVALSDGADGDAGAFDGTSIRVGLGDVAAPASHSIQFQVKVQ